MKTYRKETVTYEQDVLVEVRCDLCGKTNSSDNWSKYTDNYNRIETTIELEESSPFPEGGTSKTTELDICSVCFRDKLVPWFESHGSKPTVTEKDW